MKIPFPMQKSVFRTSHGRLVAVGVVLEVGFISIVGLEVAMGRFVRMGEGRSDLEGAG
jgi:hypothetical protein